MSNLRNQAFNLVDQLSVEDLTEVLNYAARRRNSMATSSFRLGDTVEFDAKTRGLKRGVLIKKNSKTVKVLVGSVTWTVSPSLLRKAA